MIVYMQSRPNWNEYSVINIGVNIGKHHIKAPPASSAHFRDVAWPRGIQNTPAAAYGGGDCADKSFSSRRGAKVMTPPVACEQEAHLAEAH